MTAQDYLPQVHVRDGGRCGICGNAVLIQQAHVDHIVPLAFGAVTIHDTTYPSKGDHPDNLQAAHASCNQGKGATREIAQWRHWSMPKVAPTQHPTWVLP